MMPARCWRRAAVGLRLLRAGAAAVRVRAGMRAPTPRWAAAPPRAGASRRRALAAKAGADGAFADVDDLHENVAAVTDDPGARDPEAGVNVVVFRGTADARLMVVGEAPGAEEDAQCLPFVGRSGKLLDDILRAADIDPMRDVYVTNVVKRRPPGNRDPTPEEVAFWRPYLLEQLRLVAPEVVLLVGRIAMRALAEGTDDPKVGITKLRGRWLVPREDVGAGAAPASDAVVPPVDAPAPHLMAVFHPAYLLRKPSRAPGSPKALTWRDIRVVRHVLHVSCAARFPAAGPRLAPEDNARV